MTTYNIPTQQEFAFAVLQVLSDERLRSILGVAEAIAKRLEACQVVHRNQYTSGRHWAHVQAKTKNAIAFLYANGYIDNVRVGVFEINEAGFIKLAVGYNVEHGHNEHSFYRVVAKALNKDINPAWKKP